MTDFAKRLEDKRNDYIDLIKRLLEVLHECSDYTLELSRWDDRGNPALMQEIQLAVSEAEQYLSRART